MAACQKPESTQFMVKIATDKKKDMFALGKPGRAVATHLRVLEDSVNIFCWFMCSEDKKEFDITFTDFFGAIDIQGQKVMDMKPEDKAWYKAFRLVHKDFYDFIKGSFPSIMKWTGSKPASEAQAVYDLHQSGNAPADPKPAAPAKPVEAKKEEVKAAPVKKAPVKTVVPKEPVKILKFKTWEVSNYGAETIEFTEDDVQPGMTFNFFNCTKTKVVIPGKCKNLMLQRCKKMDITINEAMSMMEVIRCEDTKIRIQTKVPCVSIELCNGIQVFASE